MALTDNIVAYYAFDGDATDATGNGHNGVVTDGPVSYEAGVNGQAARGGVQGVTPYVRVTLPGMVTLPVWTFACRVKMTAYGAQYGTLCLGPANSRGIFVREDGIPGYFFSGSPDYGSSDPGPAPLAIGVWEHVAVTYDGTTLSFYRDGIFTGDVAVNLATYSAEFNPTYLLSHTNGFWGSPLNGLIDDVAIYSRALPALEIAELEAAGAYPFTPPAGPPVVSSVSPSSGTTPGGTVVTITGTDFVATPSVTIGGVAATGEVFVSATEITCITPAHAAGAVDVVVTNPDAQTGTLNGGFTYVPSPPVVSGLSPAEGTTIYPNTVLQFDITDYSGQFTTIVVMAYFADGTYEVVYDSVDLTSRYSTSTYAAIANGFRFVLRRRGGWSSSPSLKVIGVNTAGYQNPQ